jgi:Cys-rich protein (TIGR01571 family)
VWQGQEFVADVVPANDAGGSEFRTHRTPTGRWRDGICDCLSKGLCHPALLLACFCKPLAIGQVMTRMGLSATGGGAAGLPPGSRRTSSAFKAVATVMVLYLAADYTMSLVWLIGGFLVASSSSSSSASPASSSDSTPTVPTWLLAMRFIQYLVEVLFWLYLLVALARTRAHVRKRYRIPEQHCPTGCCEDCCCSCWLPCCTTLQIARHTADYDSYPAACCTETGLFPGAPRVV